MSSTRSARRWPRHATILTVAVLATLAVLAPGAGAQEAMPLAAPAGPPGDAGSQGTGIPVSAARRVRLQALFVAKGLDGALERLRAEVTTRIQSHTTQMEHDLLARLAPDEPFRAKIAGLGADFRGSVQRDLDQALVPELLMREYADHFSDSELDHLLAFYQSPLALRERGLMEDYEQHLGDRVQLAYQPIERDAMTRYGRALRALVAECHCPRQ